MVFLNKQHSIPTLNKNNYPFPNSVPHPSASGNFFETGNAIFSSKGSVNSLISLGDNPFLTSLTQPASIDIQPRALTPALPELTMQDYIPGLEMPDPEPIEPETNFTVSIGGQRMAVRDSNWQQTIGAGYQRIVQAHGGAGNIQLGRDIFNDPSHPSNNDCIVYARNQLNQMLGVNMRNYGMYGNPRSFVERYSQNYGGVQSQFALIRANTGAEALQILGGLPNGGQGVPFISLNGSGPGDIGFFHNDPDHGPMVLTDKSYPNPNGRGVYSNTTARYLLIPRSLLEPAQNTSVAER